jgi:hypothetical protein
LLQSRWLAIAAPSRMGALLPLVSAAGIMTQPGVVSASIAM